MSDQRLARIAGVLYALNFVLGIGAMVLARQGHRAAADAMTIAGAVEYAIVVVLLARLFERAGTGLSWGVAAIGLAGCAVGVAAGLHLFGSTATALVVFGLYCLGLGALVLRSGLMPVPVGTLLMVAGIGWLTYADLPLARGLQPWNMACGIVGELVFTLWLLAFGLRPKPSALPA